MRIGLLVLFSFASAFLTGCVSPSGQLDPAIMQRVTEGSTRSEVEKIVGKPDYVVTGASDNKVAHYGYVRRIDSAARFWIGNLAPNPGDILLRHLSVLYNGNAVADKVLFYQSLTPYQAGFGYASAGTMVNPESLQRVKKGVLNEKSLIQIFGEPQFKALNPEGNTYLEWYYAKSQIGWIRDKRNMQVLRIELDDSGWVLDHELRDNVEQ